MEQSDELARLRPRLSVDALRSAIGEHWKEPGRHDEGHVFHGDLAARVTTSDAIGEVTFRHPFPLKTPIHGISLGTDRSFFESRYPFAVLVSDERENFGWAFRRTRLADGLDLTIGIKNDEIRIITLSDPDAVYPERPHKYASPALTESFDLELSAPVYLDQRPENGWCFGRPPGIGPERWPICRVHGTPLRHAFTFRLPEQYRTQGPDLIGISLFVDEMFEEADLVRTHAAVGSPESDHSKAGRRFDMEWGGTHVVLFWLTEEEFQGPLGSPLAGLDRGEARMPGWLVRSAIDYFGQDNLPVGAIHRNRDGGFDPGGYGVRQLLDAARPPSGWATLPAAEALEFGFPICVSRREGDPNVGRPAREFRGQNLSSGYVPAYSDEETAMGLERFAEFDAHLGGTMFPAQGYPNFSPFYLEFSEAFGGFAFGGGVAQLDLKEMRIEWAS